MITRPRWPARRCCFRCLDGDPGDFRTAAAMTVTKPHDTF